MAADDGLPIGDVARRAGVRPSAIRYYEDAGLIRAPRRQGGKRRYDASVFESIAIVQLAQDAGFTISEIRTLIDGFERSTPASARWQALARRKLEEVTVRIESAKRMRDLLQGLLRCRCETLGDCVRPRVAKFSESGPSRRT